MPTNNQGYEQDCRWEGQSFRKKVETYMVMNPEIISYHLSTNRWVKISSYKKTPRGRQEKDNFSFFYRLGFLRSIKYQHMRLLI